MACLVVPHEFSYEDPLDRNLFRLVNLDTTDEASLKDQIQWLFLALHSEYYALNHTEIGAALELLQDLQTGFSAVEACAENTGILFNEFRNNFGGVFRSCLADLGYYNTTLYETLI